MSPKRNLQFTILLALMIFVLIPLVLGSCDQLFHQTEKNINEDQVSLFQSWIDDGKFIAGIHYPDLRYGGDFGGIAEWNQVGVALAKETHRTNFVDIKTTSGAQVVCWWVFSDFRGDGVHFDSEGTPTGLGGTVADDISAALDLAEEEDMYIIFSIFSNNGFYPDVDNFEGVEILGMHNIAVDDTKRQALMNTVVAPLAALVESHEYSDRMIAWNIMEQPEWAVTGQGAVEDEAFDPDLNLEANC